MRHAIVAPILVWEIEMVSLVSGARNRVSTQACKIQKSLH
jgi:hypothetical protein